MRKRLFLVAVVCVLLPWLLAGCGVAQDKYDTVVAERDKAQQELQSFKADLASAQTNLKTAQTELATRKTELESSQSKITSLTAEKQALQADFNKLTDDDNAVKQQLSDIKKVYPARYFSTLNELRDWLYDNDISEKPDVSTAENLYAKALDLQESAMKDGFIVSAFIEYLEENNFWIGCKAVIDGNIYSWDVETDEPVDWSGIYGLLRVN